MTTTRNTPAAAPKSSAPSGSTKDAIALLKADHEAVSQLFAEYEKVRSDARRKVLIADICRTLEVHAQIEEEIFYPAVRKILKDKLLVPEATVEHASLKDLIDQLELGDSDAEMVDARIKVLSEYVKHHVKEEQNEMFPKVRASGLDLVALGQRMASRQEALLAANA